MTITSTFVGPSTLHVPLTQHLRDSPQLNPRPKGGPLTTTLKCRLGRHRWTLYPLTRVLGQRHSVIVMVPLLTLNLQVPRGPGRRPKKPFTL